MGPGHVAPLSDDRKSSVARLTNATTLPSGEVATASADPPYPVLPTIGPHRRCGTVRRARRVDDAPVGRGGEPGHRVGRRRAQGRPGSSAVFADAEAVHIDTEGLVVAPALTAVG